MAVILEVIRLRPPRPVSPFLVTQPVKVGEDIIPAGTTVTVSQWSTYHDSQLWPEPDTFVPLRFLDKRGQLSPLSRLPSLSAIPTVSGDDDDLQKLMLLMMVATFLHNFNVNILNTRSTHDPQAPCGPPRFLTTHPLSVKVMLKARPRDRRRQMADWQNDTVECGPFPSSPFFFGFSSYHIQPEEEEDPEESTRISSFSTALPMKPATRQNAGTEDDVSGKMTRNAGKDFVEATQCSAPAEPTEYPPPGKPPRYPSQAKPNEYPPPAKAERESTSHLSSELTDGNVSPTSPRQVEGTNSSQTNQKLAGTMTSSKSVSSGLTHSNVSPTSPRQVAGINSSRPNQNPAGKLSTSNSDTNQHLSKNLDKRPMDDAGHSFSSEDSATAFSLDCDSLDVEEPARPSRSPICLSVRYSLRSQAKLSDSPSWLSYDAKGAADVTCPAGVKGNNADTFQDAHMGLYQM